MAIFARFLSAELREALASSVEPDRRGILGTVECSRDLAVRQALPRGEEQHLLFAGGQPLKRVKHGPDLETLKRGLAPDCVGHKSLKARQEPLPSSSCSALIRENPRSDAVEPREQHVLVRSVTHAPPEDDEGVGDNLFRRAVLDTTTKGVREDRSVVVEVSATEPGFSLPSILSHR
jgi:hypothetical protein